MTEGSKSMEHDSSRETELPRAYFSAIMGMICFALLIFVWGGLCNAPGW